MAHTRGYFAAESDGVPRGLRAAEHSLSGAERESMFC